MASSAVGPDSLLDIATLKDRFRVLVHPTCGEAIAVRNVDYSRSLADLDGVDIAARNGKVLISMNNRSEASSRARTRTAVRRWCVHNQATRMATFTFSDENLPGDLDELWAKTKFFRRRLDRAGIAQPLIVPEAGSKTGRLHLHGAMRDYVPQKQLAEVWGQGFVGVGRRKAAKDGNERDSLRVQASYLAGYVAKLDAGSSFALVGNCRRRYSIPKETSPPPPIELTGNSMYELVCEAQRLCGHDLEQRWCSDESEDWEGPPTAVLMG